MKALFSPPQSSPLAAPYPPRRRWPRLGALALACLLGAFGASAASPEQIEARKPVAAVNAEDGVALKGYDSVAYFTDGKPVEGRPEFTHRWQGATYRFASAEHRDLFAKSPEKYAPQYGGYCAFAVSQGTVAPIDPSQWKIVDGRLFLNNNAVVHGLWKKDSEGHIQKGDANWRILPRQPLDAAR